MTTAPAPTMSTATPPLRRLYALRAGFAVVWAVALVLAGPALGPVADVLLVLYPLVDVAAALVDAGSSRGRGAAPGLVVNVVVSTAAAVGLVLAVGAGLPDVLRVWGAWAVAAGLVQLAVAVRRRALGGQWAMIASGSISTLAGVSFVLQAAGPHPSVVGLAGYALLGGVFFLVSALRLGRGAGARS
jgi:uncharacterized membrane protein HdeD (DUF308 family)